MKWRSKVAVLHLTQSARADRLSLVSDPREAHKKCLFIERRRFAFFSLLLDDLQQLISSFAHTHEPRRHEFALLLRQRLQSRLLDFDVQQAERVKAVLSVGGDLVVEAVGLPRIGPVGYRNGFAELVELESATSDGIHDRCVVHNLHFDILLLGSENQIYNR